MSAVHSGEMTPDCLQTHCRSYNRQGNLPQTSTMTHKGADLSQ